LSIGFGVGLGREFGVLVRNDTFLYFNLINQMPVFFLGIFAFSVDKNKCFNKFTGSRVLVLFNFLMFSVFTGLCFFVWYSGFKEAFILVPVISGISFLFLISPIKYASGGARIIRDIGKRSYSMYIFHFLFAYGLLRILAKLISSSFSAYLFLIFGYLIVVFLTFWLSGWTERLVESRGILFGRKVIGLINEK